MNMKLSLILGVCLVGISIGVIAEESQEEKDKFLECITKHNITIDKVHAIWEDRNFEDPIASRARICTWMARGIIENGKLVRSKMLKFFRANFADLIHRGENMIAVVTNCINTTDHVVGETRLMIAFLECVEPFFE